MSEIKKMSEFCLSVSLPVYALTLAKIIVLPPKFYMIFKIIIQGVSGFIVQIWWGGRNSKRQFYHGKYRRKSLDRDCMR